MKNIALAAGFLVLSCTHVLHAQGPDIAWRRVIGGISSDEGYSARVTSDSCYIVTGLTMSYGAGKTDVYLMKLSSDGDTLWTKTFGGELYDWGECVDETADGGFIIAGLTNSYGAGKHDVYLIKTDASGDTLWTNVFGGSEHDEAYSVQQTSDGGYIITGSTESYGAGSTDVYLIKTNSGGELMWAKTIGGTDSDVGGFVQETDSGEYIITGSTQSCGAGASDIYLIKTDSSGNTIWTNTIGGISDDEGYYVQQTNDGGYIVTGYSESYGAGNEDIYLVKTDSDGNTLWEKTYGGGDTDIGESVQQTSDGGYILAGFTASFGSGNFDIYIVKTTSSGDTLWTKTIGGVGYDRCNSIQQTGDNGYFAAGLTLSYGAGSSDVYLVKLNPETGIEEESGESSLAIIESIGPNPFSSSLGITYTIAEQARVELSIFDLSGRLIEELISDQLPAGTNTINWVPSQYTPDGCYLILLNCNGHDESRRCLKMN